MRGVLNKGTRLATAWLFLLAIVVNGFGHSFALPKNDLAGLAGLGLPQEVLASICISQPEDPTEESITNGCDNCRLTHLAAIPVASEPMVLAAGPCTNAPMYGPQAELFASRDHLIAIPRGPPSLI